MLLFIFQEQETPLHCAAWHGYSAVARALCEAGCLVDAKNREGESPLLTASARGFVDIVECLVEHRASLEASDKVINLGDFSSVPLPNWIQNLLWHNRSFVQLLTFCTTKCFITSTKSINLLLIFVSLGIPICL